MAKKQKSPNAHTKARTTSNKNLSDRPLSESEIAMWLSGWRTFATASHLNPSEEPVIGFNFLSIAFIMHADQFLGPLICRNKCISNRYYSQYATLVFDTPYPMTLAEFDKEVGTLKKDEVEKVFTWIPTMSVNMGRRGCYCSTSSDAPFYKLNVVTDDDGNVENIQLTVFENRNLLRKDVNLEIEFYKEKKGIFRPNDHILENFPELILPAEE